MILAPFSDAERATGDLLSSLGTTGSETPLTLQSSVPYIRLTRTGGADDRITDTATVSVDVFAPDAGTAKSVAEQVRALLLAAEGAPTAHGVIDSARTVTGPFVTPATDTDNLRLAAASYRITMRREHDDGG